MLLPPIHPTFMKGVCQRVQWSLLTKGAVISRGWTIFALRELCDRRPSAERAEPVWGECLARAVQDAPTRMELWDLVETCQSR